MFRRLFTRHGRLFNNAAKPAQQQHFDAPATDCQSNETDRQALFDDIDQSARFFSPVTPVQETRYELTASDWKLFIGEIDSSKQPITTLIDGMMPQIGITKSKFSEAP